jgi:NADH-quinone oxidoreductase subunit N
MESADFTLIIPEIFVLTMACLVLVIDAFLKDEQRNVSYLLSLATLIGAALITWNNHFTYPANGFSGKIIVNE